MSKYKPDEFYLPEIKKWATKKKKEEIALELGIPCTHLRSICYRHKISLRMPQAKNAVDRNTGYYNVKPDPFKRKVL